MRELRSDREKKLYQSMAAKLKEKIEKELYETLPNQIQNELRSQIEDDLKKTFEGISLSFSKYLRKKSRGFSRKR